MDFSTSPEPPTKRRRVFQDTDESSSESVIFNPLTGSPQAKRFFSDPDELKIEYDENAPPRTRSFGADKDVKAEEVKTEHGHEESSPRKRFFPDPEEVKIEDETDHPKKLHNGTPYRKKTNQPSPELKHESSAVSFDQETFESFVGDKVSPDVLAVIQKHCGNNLERAVNMYLDGTYKKFVKKVPIGRPPPTAISAGSDGTLGEPAPRPAHRIIPQMRYVGAFGVEGWATRSGVRILNHGDMLKIERQKIQPKRGTISRRVDVIVRFVSQSGMEIGRLAKDTADWVSSLMDQNICSFEGTCVYAPERLRTNDTVFLQLRCSLLNSAFFARGFRLADDRSANPFEQNETTDEKDLRLRQTAIIRLLQEINLQPTQASVKPADGRKGLLKAAEMDEQKQKETKKSNAAQNGNLNLSSTSDGEEGEELEQDQLDALYKKAQSFDFDTPEAEPAETFDLTLRRYQKQALYWMIAKEKDEKSNREPSMHPLWEEYEWPLKDVDDKDLPRVEDQSKFYVNPYSGDMQLEFPVQEQHCLGGILADEMGLGKTIQMLALVHSHRSKAAQRAKLSTGYLSTVNQLPRLSSNQTAVVDAPCTTLVIAPMSLLSQWKSEAEKASKEGTMKIELYYGAEKSANLQALCSSTNASQAPDIVITSYGIILSEFSSIAARNGDKSFHNGIFSLKFFRVILDEAHHIKNRASKTAKACYEISSEHRWVLTGTPIVNKLEDLFSLVRFLGVEPWNNFSFWRTFISVPFESGEFMRALDVVQTVLEPLVMRRTKDMKTPDGEPLVPLPPKQIDIVEVELSDTEREVYDYIFTKAKRTFSKNVEAGTVMKAFTTIFAQILRLRQTCCHPILVRNRDIVADEDEAALTADIATGLSDDMDLESLISHFNVAIDEASKDINQVFGAHALGEIRDESEKECPLCFEEPMNEQTVTGCWHSACKTCILDYMKHEADRGVVPKCFNCREPLNKRDLFEVVRDIDDFSKKPRISLQRLGANTSSAKIVALLSHLRTLRTSHPIMKSVIFSQFTSFLSLIEPALTRANIKFLRLDGTLAQRTRAAVLQEFADHKGFCVLLLSLRAGGVGLNLTAAGRVFMMDPWWSWAVEAQAIDRVHRMGQEGSVVVKRFVVRGSVEERMLRVQERKKFIATSLGMMSDEEKRVQRIEDIKELLS